MADEQARRDDNHEPVALAVTNDANEELVQVRVDATNGRLLVDAVTE